MVTSEIATRSRILRAGLVVTLTMGVAVAIYALGTWDERHRGGLLTIALLALADATVVRLAVKPERLNARSGVALFIGWILLHVAAGILACCLDGGIDSPLVSIFFLCNVFAATSLPTAQTGWVAGANVVAIATVVSVEHESFWRAAMWATGMVVAGGICVTVSVDRARRARHLADARMDMVHRLAKIIELRDRDTGDHVDRIGTLSGLIAGRLGLSPEEAERIRLAAPMHDVGKIAVPDAILLKPGALTADERRSMERHAGAGHEMLSGSSTDLLDLAAAIALTHHERYDGSGYPAGLRGQDIPLAGRIVAVADVFDALVSDRVYKRAMAVQDALAVIRAGRGTHFDPLVVDALVAVLHDVPALTRFATAGASCAAHRRTQRYAALRKLASRASSSCRDESSIPLQGDSLPMVRWATVTPQHC